MSDSNPPLRVRRAHQLLAALVVTTSLLGCQDGIRGPEVDPSMPGLDGGPGAAPGSDIGPGAPDPGLAVWSALHPAARSYGVAFADDGDILITGHLEDPVDFGGGPTSDDWACFIARFGPDGTHRWDRTFDGSFWPNALVVDADGNVYIAGSFEDYGTLGGEELSASGDRSDSFVASFDRDGNHRWSANFGGSQHDTTFAMAVTSDGHLAITGYAGGTTDFGGGDLESPGRFGWNVSLAVFDADGNHRWSHLFGTDGELEFDEGRSIAATADGGVAITGVAHGGVDFGAGPLAEDTPDTQYPFIASFDRNGRHVSSRLIDGLGEFRAIDPLGLASSGDRVFLAGDGYTSGPGRPFVAAYGLDGELLWVTSGSGEGYAQSLAVTGDGVAVVGHAEQAMSFGGAEIAGDGSYFFVTSLDDGGSPRWSATLDASDEDATVREPAIATSAGRVAVSSSLTEGLVAFGGESIELDDRGAAFVSVFTD